ncbi:hypothetical protein HYPSUDRAFT_157352 [Hypholoma sublateritium FD-334 SS-4]|uniref:HNH nuclease domain-containing protein n=1 Tax=Hypholoma sublateritium (strain FD-334 SS-4) TaxID=945553 RepID=A0A0D2MTB2_HYPSF|nr:hypothetical protein HYPSUDRAFT_157352 [Hypholoma sublateritium FD-334 SS-4]
MVTGGNIENNLVYVRILGCLLHHIQDLGLHTVVYEIVSCKDDVALLSVGQMYYDHYIRAFRANKDAVPTPSNHATRPSFDKMADIIKATLVEAPQSHATAKKYALIRDGLRCVITGAYDTQSVMNLKELGNKFNSDPSLQMESMQCAHIFAESPNSSIDLQSPKRDYAASMWAVMQRFGYQSLPDDLNVHCRFDELAIWFTATDIPYTYVIVTLTTPDRVKFPLPSPAYLSIHAACAKVAHLSGAAECIDKFYQDMEDRNTLSSDGSSASILEEAIRGLQVIGFEAEVHGNKSGN